MAVPKKRRIGYRLLNKGSQRRHWYLNMFGLKLSSFPSLYLKRLEEPSSLSLAKKQKFLMPLTWGGLKIPLTLTIEPKPDTKLLPSTPAKSKPEVKNPLEEAARAVKISPKGLNNSLSHKPSWGPLLRKAKPKILTLRALSLGSPVFLNNYMNACYLYNHRLEVPAYFSLNFLKKEIFLSAQLPHRWGPQKDFLLRSWELSPRHFYISPIYKKDPFESTGLLKLNHPTNLKTPKGPSLKDLWEYIKANPNEGYWMYCMWLQIIKKWKRWVRFPLQYFYKRNPWQRFIFAEYYKTEMLAYKRYFTNKSLRGLRKKLRKENLKKKSNNVFSLFTRLILLVNKFKPFKKQKLLVLTKKKAPSKRQGPIQTLSLCDAFLKKILRKLK